MNKQYSSAIMMARLSGAAIALYLCTPVFAISAVHAADAVDAGAYEDGETIIVTGQADEYSTKASVSLKTNVDLLDTPQSIGVFTREQLDDQAIQNIGDILRYTPGVSIGQGEGHRDQITIRGQNSTADFFVNGLRDDVQYYRPLYNLARVEILRGPNALLFGRGGGGGIINRITKQASVDDNFAGFSGGVDRFGAWQITADVNYVVSEGIGIRLNGLVEEFYNHRDAFNGDRQAINPTVGFELGEDTRLSISYEYIDDDRVVDRGIPSFNDRPLTGVDNIRDRFFGIRGTNRTTFEGNVVSAIFSHALDENWQVTATGQYGDYDKLYQNIFSVGSDRPGNTVTLDGYRDTTKRENFAAQFYVNGEFSTGFIGHKLLFGADYINQDSDNRRRDVLFADSNDDRITVPLDSENFDDLVHSFPVFNRNRRSDVDSYSFFIQDQISIGRHIQFITGLRYDVFDIDVNDVRAGAQFSRQDEKWSPRFGIVFKPEEGFAFYGSYSRSFLPRSGDQFLTLSPSSANAAPENFDNYEVGFKWDIENNLYFNFAAFQLDRDNQQQSIDQNGNAQLTGSRTRGIEAQLVGELAKGLDVNFGYSYLDARERLGGLDDRRLGQVPEHMVSLWARKQLDSQFALGLGVTYQGNQKARTNSSVVIPDYTRFDAALFYKVQENVQLQLNIENLFDTIYYPSVHNSNNISTGKPINARLTLRVGL